ncbi:hypothetical protein [Pediococcus acidilactici]|uniref:hypothetical protein n=1 Tax=Pediococcus acidilactici TaxID=1254 RepID=UPI001CCD3E8F|nr:hypothetical protein [Pediococcus acidilactici]
MSKKFLAFDVGGTTIKYAVIDGKLKRRSLEFELNSASSFRLLNILFCIICSLE